MTAGFEIARGAIDPSWVRWCRARVGAWFDALDIRAAAGESNPYLDVLARQSGASLGPSRRQALGTPPGILCGLVDHLLAAGLIAEGMVPTTEACSVRRQRPDDADRALGWHTDSAVINNDQGIVLWTPLDALDGYAPSLVIVPNFGRALPHHVAEPSRYLEATEPPEGGRVEIFGMEQGDVLVMPLACPHRTLITPRMNKVRFSIDLRAVAA